MIEFPEAIVLSKQVPDTLAGMRITAVIANQNPHKFAWFTGDPAAYPGLLTCRRF
jgi:formamidopyrimidine-DNA glycosylase